MLLLLCIIISHHTELGNHAKARRKIREMLSCTEECSFQNRWRAGAMAGAVSVPICGDDETEIHR